MFTVNLKSAIQFLVDNLLDRKTVPIYKNGILTRPGLYLKFEIEVGYKTTRIVKEVRMVFCGNTSVFYHLNENRIRKPIGTSGVACSEFTNSSNHDSCWRYDGFNFLDKIYFKMCDSINPTVAPVKMDSTTSWLLWTKMKQVEVKIKRKPDDSYGYDLIEIKEI